jgi:hypothetical protein
MAFNCHALAMAGQFMIFCPNPNSKQKAENIFVCPAIAKSM